MTHGARFSYKTPEVLNQQPQPNDIVRIQHDNGWDDEAMGKAIGYSRGHVEKLRYGINQASPQCVKAILKALGIKSFDRK